YRLAVHLTLACLIFAYALWIARGLAPHSDEPVSQSVSKFAVVVFLAIAAQIFLGALVAGLDAGLAFNDWPTMDGAVIPSDLWLQVPVWINAFENPKTVQFIHRMSAYAVVLLVFLQMILAYRSKSGPTHKRRTAVILVLALAQAAIGVITLVLQVPMFWGLVHQGGAVVLLGFAVAHWRGTKGAYA
ncbi:MAG: COX15/CtaA family protein, partial [Pseudomonadota bacterium]